MRLFGLEHNPCIYGKDKKSQETEKDLENTRSIKLKRSENS